MVSIIADFDDGVATVEASLKQHRYFLAVFYFSKWLQNQKSKSI